MNRPELQPFNLEILNLNKHNINFLGRVKVLDIHEGASKNFHPDGLFSYQIFGRAGDKRRDLTFGYINLNINIFHPLIFQTIIELKQQYLGIIKGDTKVIFDTEEQDFVLSNDIKATSGFNYFIDNFEKIDFKRNNSGRRNNKITILEKYKSDLFLDKILVIPAGLRPYEIDENGKPSEDEINSLYRKVLSIANTLENINVNLNLENLDKLRFNLQLAVLEIYKYLENLLDGKKSFLMDKFANRKIVNSTRNVITSYTPDIKNMDSPNLPNINDTVINLFQFMKTIQPITINRLKNGFLAEVFSGNNSPSLLVNKENLNSEFVNVSRKYFDLYNNNKGIEKLVSQYGYYLGLIYKGPDKTFRLMHDISELPDHLNKEHVTPITFTELFYISLKNRDMEDPTVNTPSLVTRYPVAGYGGIFPSYNMVKTTFKSEIRTELDRNWEKTDNILTEFPIYGAPFYNSMSLPQPHMARAVADHDGDMCNNTAFTTENAKDEIKHLLSSKKYYVDINNKLAFTSDDYLEQNIASSMTK